MLKKLLIVLSSLTISGTILAPTQVQAQQTIKHEQKQKQQFKQTGIASWYGRQFHGRKTANGETFNMYSMTGAHRTLPLGCTIRVTNKSNGKSVILKVNDRGPFHGNRILDVSYSASKALGFTDSGVANVKIEVLNMPKKK